MARLAETSRDLADLYEVAIDLVANPDAPARMLLLGHCMREIGNRLPEILNPDLPGRSRQDEAVRSLAGDWRAAGLSLSLDRADDTEGGRAAVPVPRQIVRFLSDFQLIILCSNWTSTSTDFAMSPIVVGLTMTRCSARHRWDIRAKPRSPW